MCGKHIQIGIVAYAGVQQTAVHGLTDMLLTANQLIPEFQPDCLVSFSVTHWNQLANTGEMQQGFSTRADVTGRPTVVILPGSLQEDGSGHSDPHLLDWIREQHQSGTIICSVCNGAFVLAQSGIADGRKITTHWVLEHVFSTRFPNIPAAIDRIVIDHGDIITAGGVMAWIDLGLQLIRRFAGPDVMLAVARYLLVDPAGREQSFYSYFRPNLEHNDELVSKAQHWIHEHFHKALSLQQLAKISATSIRTLIRRFQNVLKLNPTAYIQQVRVAKARELLEQTTLPLNQVAWKVGYEDPASFRKVFLKSLGLSPAAYRRRFNINMAQAETNQIHDGG